jgi:ligand-binding sensor domain-containing protein
VYDIFCDSNHRVWISTYTGGLSFFDQTSPLVNQIHRINHSNSLSNDNVNKIIEDSEGKLWFATNNGVSSWDRTSDRWKTYYHNKQGQAQVFLSLCEDDQGRIWAGTTEKFTVESGLPSNYVSSILYADGYLWLGTHLSSGYDPVGAFHTRYLSIRCAIRQFAKNTNAIKYSHPDSQVDIWFQGSFTRRI